MQARQTSDLGNGTVAPMAAVDARLGAYVDQARIVVRTAA